MKYRNPIDIPYYEEIQKRAFLEKLRKVKNTVLLLIAYACPSLKLRILFHRLRGVNIGKDCYIGMFCFIDNLYPEFIYIEDEACINTGSMLIAHITPLIRYKRILQSRVSPIIIKSGALIAVKCIILPGVIIGQNAIVAAGSVVNENVEAQSLVRGNPAKKVGKIKILLS